MQANRNSRRSEPVRRRRRVTGTRAQQACLHCKDKKLKCDEQSPACRNCQKAGIPCLIPDHQTKKPRPRNYLELLEDRVASLQNHQQETPSHSTISPRPTTTGNISENSLPNSYTTSEQAERSGDLSSRVGMLDFRTTQIEPQYLGSSSAFAFSRIVHYSLNRDLPLEPKLSSLTDEHHSSPSPCMLPDHDVAMTLSNAYFKHIHPQYPFLHEPTFRAWETMLYDSSSPDLTDIGLYSSPMFFLNMVYAVGALLMPHTQSLAKQLYISAQLYADVLSKDNLESIQALLCYSMYSLRSLTGPSLWKLSGLALRQCIELGYHRSVKRMAPTVSLLLQEMRKRVFWVAHGVDCMIALRLGRPLCVPLQEIDAEFPKDINDNSITELGISSPPRGDPSQASTTMSTALHVFQLRHIWARIHTYLFSDISRPRVHEDAYLEIVQQLRADLDIWLATAPPSQARANSDLSFFNTREWYDMNYNYTIILLYRGYLEEYNESSDHIFEECIMASQKICQVYRRLYVGTTLRYTWGTLHCLILAGLTYLHCLWASPTAWRSIRPDDVSKTCTDCTMVLVAIAEGWQGAAPYRDTFEALANRTVTMMINRNCTTSPQKLLPTTEGFGNEDSWSHWINDMSESGILDGIDGLLTGFMNDFAHAN